MDTGHDFLRAQVNNCIAQHQSLIDALHAQVEPADDLRLRTLCDRHIPKMQPHQTMLEENRNMIGSRRTPSAPLHALVKNLVTERSLRWRQHAKPLIN